MSLHRIITLSDNLIQILNSDNLQFIPSIKLKNIITFAVTNKPAHGVSIDICVSTKRSKLQIYRLDRTNINLLSEISIQEPIISIAMDERGILACSKTIYYSCMSKKSNDRHTTTSLRTIFSLYDQSVPTCFTNIRPGEYILNGPNIGITATLEGTSDYRPIAFVEQPNNFIYSYPYIITLTRDFIRIYSYLDGQPKQEFPIKDCQSLLNICQENINHVLVNTNECIYLLESVDIETQIDQLLNMCRLEEALALAESHNSSIDNNPSDLLLLSTKKRVGLIGFKAKNIVQALELFDQINLDYHELMTEIPHFLPLNSPWPQFHEKEIGQYIQWLNGFCDYLMQRSVDFSLQSDYYASILKAYLIIKARNQVIEFLEKNAAHISVDFYYLLFYYQFYHGAAILHAAHEKHEQTINIWKKIILDEYPADDTFPGIGIIVKYVLERDLNRSFEFSIAQWLLEQREDDLAIEIFIRKYRGESPDDPFHSIQVINTLQSSPNALRHYLEEAVFKLSIETTEIHTMLANIYLDRLLSDASDTDNQIRSKLQEFLIKSNLYRIESVLNRVLETDRFKHEVALLYGKMNKYEEAFQILVDDLKDFEYAQSYCITLSRQKSTDDRKIIAHILFKVFLEALEKHPNEITPTVTGLLCSNEIEFDFIEILRRLPSYWPISSIQDILLRSVRTSSSIQRSTSIEAALTRLQNEKLNIKLAELKSSNIVINEYRRCKHCLKQFYETSCIIYHDGSQVHIHCAKRIINPK